jgi:bifunctional ADP-heptose synthase (sugar kinase/adenylyltransferase)
LNSKSKLSKADAVIVGDYGKGVVTQPLLNEIKSLCRERGVWLSLDPEAGASFEFEQPVAHHAEPQGGV